MEDGDICCALKDLVAPATMTALGRVWVELEIDGGERQGGVQLGQESSVAQVQQDASRVEDTALCVLDGVSPIIADERHQQRDVERNASHHLQSERYHCFRLYHAEKNMQITYRVGFEVY